MRRLLRAWLLLATCSAFGRRTLRGRGSEPAEMFDPEKDQVNVMTQDSFDAEIAAKPHLVMFYAPWCGHCRVLAPKLIQASKQLLDDPTVADAAGIGVCNAEQNPLLLRRYRIGGFPTVLFLAEGKDPKPYWGAREVHDIAEFVRAEARALAPPVHPKEVRFVNRLDKPVRLLFDGHMDQGTLNPGEEVTHNSFVGHKFSISDLDGVDLMNNFEVTHHGEDVFEIVAPHSYDGEAAEAPAPDEAPAEEHPDEKAAPEEGFDLDEI